MQKTTQAILFFLAVASQAEALKLAQKGIVDAFFKKRADEPKKKAAAVADDGSPTPPPQDTQEVMDRIAASTGIQTFSDLSSMVSDRVTLLAGDDPEAAKERAANSVTGKLKAMAADASVAALDSSLFGEKAGQGLKQSNNPFMPKCYEVVSIRDLRDQKWCDPSRVPAENRLPKKLQGLYWMKWDDNNVWAMDVAVCMSTGEFDPVKKMMKMTTFKQFIYKDTAIGNAASIGANPQNSGAHYECTFDDNLKDDELSSCHFQIVAKSGLAKSLSTVSNLTVETARFEGENIDSTLGVANEIAATTNLLATGEKKGVLDETLQGGVLNALDDYLPGEKRHAIMRSAIEQVKGEGDVGKVDLGNWIQNFMTGYDQDQPMWLREVDEAGETMQLHTPWLLKDGKKSHPGEVMNRISVMRNRTEATDLIGQKSHHYPWIKIMDGDMNVQEESYNQMVKHFESRGVYKAVRYTDECEGSLTHDVLTGRKDIAGNAGVLSNNYDPKKALKERDHKKDLERTVRNTKENFQKAMDFVR